MFTAGGGHARLSCRQGTDLRTDVVCKLVLSLCLGSMATGPCSQHIERILFFNDNWNISLFGSIIKVYELFSRGNYSI